MMTVLARKHGAALVIRNRAPWIFTATGFTPVPFPVEPAMKPPAPLPAPPARPAQPVGGPVRAAVMPVAHGYLRHA